MSYQPKPLSFWLRFSPTGIRTSDDHQTPGQTTAIRGISNAQRIDADRACKELFNCAPDDLNKAAAATFINWLKNQQQQGHVIDALNFCPTCQHLMMRKGDVMVCREGHRYEIAAIEAA
jgi:hypothetical protein